MNHFRSRVYKGEQENVEMVTVLLCWSYRTTYTFYVPSHRGQRGRLSVGLRSVHTLGSSLVLTGRFKSELVVRRLNT